MGRCIGASLPLSPKSSHISNAVRCSVKKVELLAIGDLLFWGSASGQERRREVRSGEMEVRRLELRWVKVR
jgi:hypothetical protein